MAILVNEGEVQRCFEDCERDQLERVFQEYVDAADQKYTVGVLVSRTGELIDCIVVHRKLLELSLGPHRLVGGRAYSLSTDYFQWFVIRHLEIQQHGRAGGRARAP